MIYDVNGNKSIFVADMAAAIWQSGAIEPYLGKLEIPVEVADNAFLAIMYQGYTGRINKLSLFFEIKALAYTVSGQGEAFALRDVVNHNVERRSQKASFPVPETTPLIELHSSEELAAYQAQYDAVVSDGWHFTRVVHVPRVQHGKLFFPLSQRVQKQLLAPPQLPLPQDKWEQIIGSDIETIGWEE